MKHFITFLKIGDINMKNKIKMKPLKRITNPSENKKQSFIPFLPIIAILFISIATISIVNKARNPKFGGGGYPY